MKLNNASHRVRNSEIYFHGKLRAHHLQTKYHDQITRLQATNMKG